MNNITNMRIYRLPEAGRWAERPRQEEEEAGVLRAAAPHDDDQARRGELHRGMVRSTASLLVSVAQFHSFSFVQGGQLLILASS
jgi:hypothetical protein